jgi:hypothetical protein
MNGYDAIKETGRDEILCRIKMSGQMSGHDDTILINKDSL